MHRIPFAHSGTEPSVRRSAEQNCSAFDKPSLHRDVVRANLAIEVLQVAGQLAHVHRVAAIERLVLRLPGGRGA